jgi:hypothetical protein
MSHGIGKLGMRVGDEERHKAAEILSDHHAHGRLTQEEFEDRLGAALTAQTTAELGRLLADLPLRHEVERPESVLRPVVGELGQKLGRLTRRAAPTVAALSGIVAMAAATGGVSTFDFDGREVFLYALGTGVFGLLAGRATAWIARRRRSNDEQRPPYDD